MDTSDICEAGFTEKFFIWLRWNLYVLGTASVLGFLYISQRGLPAVCKTVELSQLNERVEMLGMAMSEVQDYQVRQAQSGVRLAKK